MNKYETYKALHIFSVIFFFSTIHLVAKSENEKISRLSKISTIVSFLLLFIFGMGLISSMGFKHYEVFYLRSKSFPVWFHLKIINWFLLGICFFILYKLKNTENKTTIIAIIFLQLWISIWLVINKPLVFPLGF